MDDDVFEAVLAIAKETAKSIRRYDSLSAVDTSGCFDVMAIKGRELHFITQKYPGPKRYQTVKGYFDVILSQFKSPIPEGFYSINMYDSASHNDHTIDFSKIPDVYQMNNYADIFKLSDPFPVEYKMPRMVFAGSSTGVWNIRENDRIQVCAWGMENRDIADFYITDFLQKDFDELTKVYGENAKNFVGDFYPIIEQMKYKFILNIDGNAASWNRPIWAMNFNSVLFHYKSTGAHHRLWYSDLLKDGEHYVEVTKETMREKVNYYAAHHDEVVRIIQNAQSFVRRFLAMESHLFYTIALLTCIQENQP